MGKEVEKTVVEETTITTSPEEKIEETVTDSTKETVKADETKKVDETKLAEEKKDEKATQETADELFDAIQKGEDGKYFLPAGDSTYYGSTKKEVLDNLLKGKIEQDTFIRETKVGVKLKETARDLTKENDEEKELEIPAPNQRELFAGHVEAEAKRQNIPIDLFTLTEDQWDTYAEDNNKPAWRVADLHGKVVAIRDKAFEKTNEDVAKIDRAWIDKETLDVTSEKIRKFIAKSGVNPDDIDYKAIFEYGDKNKDKNGLLVGAALLEETARQVLELKDGQYKSSSKVTADVQKAIENGERLKNAVKSATTGGDRTQPIVKQYASYEELDAALKAQIRAGTA